MHTLGIAEDRRQVLEGLLNNVPWERHGFQVVFAVDNGSKALAAMRAAAPDILVSDIKMPDADGLELAKYVSENRLLTKVILISAFDEFEFAQQAIKSGVYDYLLKPIDYARLLEICQKAATEHEQEQRIRYHIKTSIPALQEKFFSDLVSRSGRPDLAQAEYLGIDLSGEYHLCGIVCLDNYETLACQQGVEAMEVMIYKIADQLRGIDFADNLWVFRARKDQAAFVLGFGADQKDAVSERLYQFLERLSDQFRQKNAGTITTGLGKIACGPDGIVDSFQDAALVEEYKFRMGRGKVYDLQAMPAAFRKRNHFPFAMESMLMKYVLLGNVVQTREVLSELNAHLSSSDFSQDAIRLFISNLAFKLAFQASGVEGESPEGDGVASVSRHVRELNELEKIMRWFEDYCLRLCENNNANYDSQYRALTAQVDDYILSHYNDSDFRLETIARSVGMNSSYLSTVYKRVRGYGISERLTGTRIEQSQVLLKTTALKIYEIAEMVGFSNQYYFSAAFKKQTGLPPNEYRGRSDPVPAREHADDH